MDDNTKTKNLDIWDEAKETDPRFTKKVSFGARSFTSIDAHYQIRRATEIFGPVGTGWGYDVSYNTCLLYTSPSPRDGNVSRMPSSA